MKSIEKQKTTIKSKFKTLQRFIMITGLDHKKAQSYFAGRMAQDDVDDFQLTIKTLIKETKSNHDLSIIDDTTRMSIWRMIKWHYRTLKSFSIEYPEFPQSYLTRVFNGKKIRRDQRFNDLLQVAMTLGTGKKIKQNSTKYHGEG
jgi:hypothetical protein